MLKVIVLALLVVLTAVNLVLLWQIFRKIKQNMDKQLETIEPYITVRLTVFCINMAIICVIGIGKALLQIFFHA